LLSGLPSLVWHSSSLRISLWVALYTSLHSHLFGLLLLQSCLVHCDVLLEFSLYAVI
jgi:hypothetical protein